MHLERNTHNLSAFQFNLSTVETIKNICLPLKDLYGLTYFTYLRLYENGLLFRLSNHKGWSISFFEDKYYEEVDFYQESLRKVPEAGKRSFLWIAQKRGPYYSGLHKHNIWNGISLCNKNGQYIESFNFGTTIENDQINNHYIEIQADLLKFGNYFKKQIKELIKIQDSSRFISSNIDFLQCRHNEDKAISSFLNQTLYKP